MSIPQDLLCNTDGKCYANFKKDGKMDKPDNYLILETDYENFTLVYTCMNFPGGFAYFDTLWYMQREPYSFSISKEFFDDFMVPVIEAAIPNYNWKRWGTWVEQGHDVCTYE